MRPNQAPPSRAANATSAEVGTLGSTGLRCADNTARARTWPDEGVFTRQRHYVEHHVDMPGDDVLQRERRAAIMDVNEPNSRELLELLADEMATRTDSLCRVCQAVCLAVCDELLHRCHRQRCLDDDDVRRRQHQRDGGEVFRGS